MRVAIAGAGNVGLFIANDLARRRPRRADHRAAPRGREAGAEPGDGIEWHIADCCEVNSLRAAGLDSCDVVVAATGDDEDNLVLSLLAKQEFAVPRVIARVNHPKNEWLFNENWGVDLSVSTPHLITALVEEAVTVGRLVRILQFEGGQARLVEVTLADNSPVIDRALKDIDVPRNATVVAIVRDEHVVMPRGDSIFEAGRRGAGDGDARIRGRGAPHPHRRLPVAALALAQLAPSRRRTTGEARSIAGSAQQLVDRVEQQVALAVARADALEGDLAPGESPAILRRPRNTPTIDPRPSLTVTSSAGAPARGTIRTERTSPPTFTRVRGSMRVHRGQLAGVAERGELLAVDLLDRLRESLDHLLQRHGDK